MGNNVVAFVDSSVMYRAARALNVSRLEYAALAKWFRSRYGDSFLRPYVYIMVHQDNKLDGLVRFLRSTGYTVRTKGYDERWSTHVHTMIHDDVVRLTPTLERAIFVGCDPALIPVVEWLKEHGVYVELLTLPQLVSFELQDSVDRTLTLDSDSIEGIVDENVNE